MSSLINNLLDPQFVVMVLSAIAAFATVTSFVLPLLSNDRLGPQMKYVAGERGRLRAERMTRLADDQRQSKLRKDPKSFMKQIVERLNLRKALETEGTRERLKMAGFRGQAPVIGFLFFRAVLPILTFALVFFYLFFWNTHGLAPLIRLALSIGGAYVGFYLPNIFVSNMIQKRQKSMKRVFPDALDLLLICVQAGMSIESAMNKVANEIGSRSLELAEEFGLAAPGLRESRQANRHPGGEGRGHEPDSGRALRHRHRTSLARALQGKPGDAHGRGREEGRVAAAEAHRADDRILSAGAVRRDSWPCLSPVQGTAVGRAPSLSKTIRIEHGDGCAVRPAMTNSRAVAAS
jgi:tight adherence protein C